MNGIRATLKGDAFDKFMESAKPDILCLNETKIDEDAITSAKVKEKISKWFPMDLQFWNCAKKKGYSGTAVFISKDFKGGIPSSVEYDFGKEGVHDLEGRTITCHFKTFILVATYVPNSGVPGLQRLEYRIKSWDKDFHSFLKDELETEHKKPVILAGDLNVAHHEIDIYCARGRER